MRIDRIRIVKLFGILDYDVEWLPVNNILILTGPNGFGKTQILNIIHSLFNKQLWFFQQLSFEEIEIYIGKQSIKLTKKQEKHQAKIKVNLMQGKKSIESSTYSLTITDKIFNQLDRMLPIPIRFLEGKLINVRTGIAYTLEEIISEYKDFMPKSFWEQYLHPQIKEKTSKLLEQLEVHIIKEQRLFKKVSRQDNYYRGDYDDKNIMTETIRTYAQDLCNRINSVIQKSFVVAQSLDSTYPTRLISEKDTVSEEDYLARSEKLAKKQDKLQNNSLYERKQDKLEYSKSDSKALLVYLNDLEEKLGVFDDLLQKLELFTNILNNRRFTFKSIKINKKKGFIFETTTGQELDLNRLSSGEQHEVVLLYELIFNTQNSTMVLIDEPEISLHITWQKEFINDLLKIIDIQNFQVVIATHSPSIINDRWDFVYNLESMIDATK